MIGTLTYTNAEVTRSNIASEVGKVLPQVPDWQASLFLDYRFRNGPLEGLGLGGGVRYTGDSYGDAANTILIPGYTLVDAAIHYDLSYLDPKLKGVNVAINATNLFDKYYVATCQNLNACFIGTGRTVLASMRYNW